MKKIKSPLIVLCFGVALLGITKFTVFAQQEERVGAVVVTSTNACAGKFYAYAKMTNGQGSIWIQPTNPITSSGVLTDLSSYPSPYSSTAVVQALGSTNYFCGSNSVTFPATNTSRYQLMIVVTSPTPALTNGQPMNIQIDWK